MWRDLGKLLFVLWVLLTLAILMPVCFFFGLVPGMVITALVELALYGAFVLIVTR